jgi:hypothetical protein
MIEFLRQDWHLIRERLLLYWHHPWQALAVSLMSVVIALVFYAVVFLLSWLWWRPRR